MILDIFRKKVDTEGWQKQPGISKKNATMSKAVLAQHHASKGKMTDIEEKFLEKYNGSDIREMYFFCKTDEKYVYELRLHEEQKKRAGQPEYQAHKQWVYLITRKPKIEPGKINKVLKTVKDSIDNLVIPEELVNIRYGKEAEQVLPKYDETGRKIRSKRIFMHCFRKYSNYNGFNERCYS